MYYLIVFLHTYVHEGPKRAYITGNNILNEQNNWHYVIRLGNIGVFYKYERVWRKINKYEITHKIYELMNNEIKDPL